MKVFTHPYLLLCIALCSISVQSQTSQSSASNSTKQVVQITQKQLWGITALGGTNSDGTIFKIDRAGNKPKVKHNFEQSGGNNTRPNGSLIQATNGKLYGLSHYGGANDQGVLFQIDAPTSAFAVKVEFNGTAKGRFPDGSLVQASNGNLYGMTSGGGNSDNGVIFMYNPTTGAFLKIYDFDGNAHGGSPYGSLIQALDGKLYGMTSEGGVNSKGTIFSYDLSTDICTVVLSLGSNGKGQSPYGSLVQTSDGKMYGLCYKGGGAESGLLFQFDPQTSSYLTKYEFDGANNGGEPMGSLYLANDSKLYGVTFSGGIHSMGVLFQYDPATSTYTKKFDFDEQPNGASPLCTLVQNIDGMLFGMCSMGGATTGPTSQGCVFTYNITTNTLTKKLDFTGANGANPAYTAFVEIPVTIATTADASTRCAATSFTVAYTIAGAYDDDNVFSVQLSDATGSFDNAVVIGTVNSTQLGTINATIPANTPSGTAYRVRVVASGPVVLGSDNGTNIIINGVPDSKISTTGNTLSVAQAAAQYQWYNCANSTTPIDGATNQSYTATLSGSYAVQITNPDTHCSVRSNCVDITVSDVADASQSGWYMSPNPAAQVLHVHCPWTSPTTLQIINILGECVLSTELNNLDQTVSIQNLTPGMYVVRLQTMNNVFSGGSFIKAE